MKHLPTTRKQAVCIWATKYADLDAWAKVRSKNEDVHAPGTLSPSVHFVHLTGAQFLTVFHRKIDRSRASLQNEQNVWLFAPTPTPSEILIPDLYLGDSQLLPDDVIECAISSRQARGSKQWTMNIKSYKKSQFINTQSLAGRHSEYAVLPSRRNSAIPLIPESPPPAYTQQENSLLNAFLSVNSKPLSAICSSVNSFFPCKNRFNRPTVAIRLSKRSKKYCSFS